MDYNSFIDLFHKDIRNLNNEQKQEIYCEITNNIKKVMKGTILWLFVKFLRF